MSEAHQQPIDGDRHVIAGWLAHQEPIDRMLTPYGEATLRAADVRPGEAVLDIGCGAGATALDLARRVRPGGTVVGVDISEPLIRCARERATAVDVAVDFLLADAGRHPFVPASFDLLFSRFGVMFFDDPAGAFTSLHRALAPGGRLVFACWRSVAENDWYQAPLDAVREILPPLPPIDPLAPGPFALADRDRVDSILREAGFTDVVVAPFDAPLVGVGETQEAAIDDALDQASRVGPLSRLLGVQTKDVRNRATAAARAALARHATTDGVIVIPAAAWIVTARG